MMGKAVKVSENLTIYSWDFKNFRKQYSVTKNYSCYQIAGPLVLLGC